MQKCVGKLKTIVALFLILSLFIPFKSVLPKYIVTPKQVSSNDYVCMSKALYFEARGESTTGIIAVANVILNRKKNKKFPDDICNIVHQRTKYTCQFSWVCDNPKFDMSKVPNRVKVIAAKAIQGQLKDVTGGALFFHSLTMNPWDNLRHTRTVGRHNFYKY